MKNSWSVISRPSQNFLTVIKEISRLDESNILYAVEGVTPDNTANSLIAIFRCLQISLNLSTVASFTFINNTPRENILRIIMQLRIRTCVDVRILVLSKNIEINYTKIKEAVIIMTKHNGVEIESVEQAQKIVSSSKMWWIRWLVALVLSLNLFLVIGEMVPSWLMQLIRLNPIAYWGVLDLIILLLLGKIVYLLSLIKRAWLYGWETFDMIPFITQFFGAYICVAFVGSFIAVCYCFAPLLGTIMSGARYIKTQYGCRKILKAAC